MNLEHVDKAPSEVDLYGTHGQRRRSVNATLCPENYCSTYLFPPPCMFVQRDTSRWPVVHTARVRKPRTIITAPQARSHI